MTVPMALAGRRRVPWRRRPLPLAAVAVARVLARLSPARIRRVLERLRRGARSATSEQASAARAEVVGVSLRCAGQNCLQRSIATALLCRVRGTWPTWCVGVRTHPFASHAWVEVAATPIDEPYGAGHFRRTMTVPPVAPAAATPPGPVR